MGKITIRKVPNAQGFYYVTNHEGETFKVVGLARAQEIAGASRRLIIKRKRRVI